jgi:hypothetical protein
MARAKAKEHLFCSFCRKSDAQVRRLIAGPGCYICDACVNLCNGILRQHESAGDVSWGGYKEMSEAQLLSAIKDAEAMLEAVRSDLQAKVDVLRAREVSWQAIGDSLGISRQAAWERFS